MGQSHRGVIQGACKEMRPILRALSKQGWELGITGSNHIKAHNPDNETSVWLPLTPNAHRIKKQILPRLRKAGFDER